MARPRSARRVPVGLQSAKLAQQSSASFTYLAILWSPIPSGVPLNISLWKEHVTGNVWHVKVRPSSTNGLRKTSAVNALQLRGVDTQRFVRKLGSISSAVMRSLVAAIAAVVEY